MTFVHLLNNFIYFQCSLKSTTGKLFLRYGDICHYLIYHDFHDNQSYNVPEFAYYLKHKERMGKNERRGKYTEAVIDVAISAGIFTKDSFEKLKLVQKILKEMDELLLATGTKNTLKLAYSIIGEVAIRFSYLDTQEKHFFLSCRQLAKRMNKDVRVANKVINFLCILEVLVKLPKEKGIEKADIFQLRDVPLDKLKLRAEILKKNGVTLANFSRKRVAKVLPPEKIKEIFRRDGPGYIQSTRPNEKEESAIVHAVRNAIEIFDGEIVES